MMIAKARLSRRGFTSAALAGLIGASARGRRADAASNVVRLGYLYPNLTTLIHGIAKSIGAYDKHNITVIEQRFTSGQTIEGVQDLWQGNLDLYFGGGPEIVSLNSRSIESGAAAPLAVISGANAGHTSFVLSSKLQPKTFDELIGKPLRIAVSSPSSDHMALFRGWLRVDRKITEQQLGWQFLPLEGADMPTALLTDQIDGFLHSEPTTTIRAGSTAIATLPLTGPRPSIALPRNGARPSMVPRYFPVATNRCVENAPLPAKVPHGPCACSRLIGALASVPASEARSFVKCTPAMLVFDPLTTPAKAMWLPEPPPATDMPKRPPSTFGICGSAKFGNAW